MAGVPDASWGSVLHKWTGAKFGGWVATRFTSAEERPSIWVKWILSKANVEPNPGGVCAFSWLGGYEMRGPLIQLVKNQSIWFQWVDAQPDGPLVKTRHPSRARLVPPEFNRNDEGDEFT